MSETEWDFRIYVQTELVDLGQVYCGIAFDYGRDGVSEFAGWLRRVLGLTLGP